MRVIVLGNAGAGKSTMTRRLVAGGGVGVLSLDEIVWGPGAQRLPIDESITLLKQFVARHERWVIEGCYGQLAEAALAYGDELRFLNPGVEVCTAHCLRRPWEPNKFPTPEAQQAALGPLIEWVQQYEIRDDEYGLAHHRAIFNSFAGRKIEYQRVEDYALDP